MDDLNLNDADDKNATQLFADIERRKKLILRTQLQALIISGVVVSAVLMNSHMNWCANPAILFAFALPFITFLIILFVLRSSLSKALARQAAVRDQMKDYLSQKAATQDPALQQELDRKIAVLAVNIKKPAPPAFTLFLIGAGVTTGYTAAVLHPFRPFESFLFLALLISPFLLGLGFALLQGKPNWPYKPLADDDVVGRNQGINSPYAKSIPIMRFMIAAAALVMFAELGLALNQWLDQSIGELHSYPIVEKHTTINKGRTYYHVEFMSPAPSPIPALDFGGKENLHVDQNSYNHVVPNQTQVSLTTHPGFFHLPWYDQKYSFTGL